MVSAAQYCYLAWTLAFAVSDPLQVVVGTVLVLAPGFALALAFLPRLDPPKFIVVGVILALTVTPASVYVLDLYLGVPITPMNFVLVSLAWTAFAGAWWLRPRLHRAWG